MPEKRLRIAFIGSYVPRQCGIATFTRDLSGAVAGALGNGQGADAPAQPESKTISIVAMSDREGEYRYGPEVQAEIRQHRREDYRNAAEILNTGRVDVVSLQHEYGLFGGESGEYLFELLNRLHKPLVCTLHTVLGEPSPSQRDVLHRICRRASTVVVMAERARVLLNEVYDIPLDRIKLIHHGVPDVPFTDCEPYKARFGLAGRPTILSFGLLSPSKSTEVTLDALAKVVPTHPNLAFIVLGVTHPVIRRESGELYRLSLERRALELGIQKNVLFHNRFVSNEDLREYLQAADVYVTPYAGKDQITSGTLAYALASGRAIISTPYWYAQELLADGRGRLMDFGDVDGCATALRELLDDKDGRDSLRRAAHEHGRQMVWSHVGEQYVKTFEHAHGTFADTAPDLVVARKVLMRLSLPEVRLDHLFTMTDDTGILQHALYSTPDRRHGYCSDDNARAMIVAAMVWTLFQDERVLPYLHTYLSFLHYAHKESDGRFLNFMSYDRRWLEQDGSDDSQGRVFWALGYLISHAPSASARELATDLFRDSMRSLSTLKWPRSSAFAVLGLHYYLRAHGDDAEARQWMATFADQLDARFAEGASEDWPWFEDTVTYDNGRIPQALIMAGLGLERQDIVDRGLGALRWLMKIQTAEAGYLSAIGNNGWYHRGGEPAVFDQQPLEPAALIGACKAAYRASDDGQWLIEMRRCFEWYVGRNALGTSMVDFRSRGCHDGLKESGLNSNQGAESLLSWLLSLLIMHEMQTGDAPEVG